MPKDKSSPQSVGIKHVGCMVRARGRYACRSHLAPSTVFGLTIFVTVIERQRVALSNFVSQLIFLPFSFLQYFSQIVPIVDKWVLAFESFKAF